MPFVQRRQFKIPRDKKAEEQLKMQLKSSLANPHLSDAQRARILDTIQRIRSRKPKVYKNTLPPMPGALETD